MFLCLQRMADLTVFLHDASQSGACGSAFCLETLIEHIALGDSVLGAKDQYQWHPVSDRSW